MEKCRRLYVAPLRTFDASRLFNDIFFAASPSTHFWYYPNLNAIGVVHDHPSQGYEVVSHHLQAALAVFSPVSIVSFSRCLRLEGPVLGFHDLHESLYLGSSFIPIIENCNLCHYCRICSRSGTLSEHPVYTPRTQNHYMVIHCCSLLFFVATDHLTGCVFFCCTSIL